MMKRTRYIYKPEEKIEESVMSSGIRITRDLSINEFESLTEGQLVLDESGMSAIVLNVEIVSHLTEKHIYLKLSSCPKTILIIK